MKTLVAILVATAGCTGSEAARVELPVTTDPTPFAAATTDLGYAITITQMEAAVTAIQFTIEGESHEDASARIVAPHPGHAAGGEVTGELPGDFILTWNGQAHDPLGTGTLIVGDYHGANFAFRAATASDTVLSTSIVGHSIHIAGTATKAGETHPFDMLFDVEVDTSVIGAVFEDTVGASSTETLAIAFYPTDAYERDTAFDGFDFFALPRTGDAIEIRPGSAAHNILRRTIQSHDHYGVTVQ
jgi:hypothetical protein